MPGQLFHSREVTQRKVARMEVRYGVLVTRLLLLMLAAVALAMRRGFAAPPAPDQVLLWVQWALFLFYGLDVWLSRWHARVAVVELQPNRVEGGLWLAGLLCGLIGAWQGSGSDWTMLSDSALVLLICVELWRLHLGLSHTLRRPGLMLPMSFLMLIAVGTVLLKLPLAAAPGRTIGWYDALFTMTSAVCVTGLIVRDTATDFSPFGQAIIGIFIQLGGLGIIIFGSVLAMLIGASISLRQQTTLSQMLDDQPLHRLSSLVKFIVLGTLLIELIGAAAMYPLWPSDLSWQHRAGLSLFHSVSAFCNAGFALQTDSLVPFRFSPLSHAVVIPLLVLGGLGFPVLRELVSVGNWQWNFRRGRWLPKPLEHQNLAAGRLSLHTRLVLTTTAGLYLLGFVAILLAQLLPYAHDELQLGQTVNQQTPRSASVVAIARHMADASFMSFTARTAGFNTMPMDQLQPAATGTVMMLMCVGGSPGGTAGGVKTITLALLLLSILATVRSHEQTEAFDRQIVDALVRRAGTIAMAFVALVAVATFLLLLSEPYPLMPVMFEAVSAASTTGLSLGITGELTAFGRGVIIVTMFLGRVGPLALMAAAVGMAVRRRGYAYPHESVMLG